MEKEEYNDVDIYDSFQNNQNIQTSKYSSCKMDPTDNSRMRCIEKIIRRDLVNNTEDTEEREYIKSLDTRSREYFPSNSFIDNSFFRGRQNYDDYDHEYSRAVDRFFENTMYDMWRHTRSRLDRFLDDLFYSDPFFRNSDFSNQFMSRREQGNQKTDIPEKKESSN